MPRPLLSVVIWGVWGVALPLGAAAAPLQGEVTASQGRWTADGSRIVTESVIHTDAGQDVVVSQLGGTADGLTMRLFASDGRGDGVDALPLVVGARVSLEIHGAATTEGRIVQVVDRVVQGGSADFVRTGPTKAGKFLSWASGCAQLYYDSAGTGELAGDTEFALIDEAVASWNSGVAACSYMNIATQGKKSSEVGKDFTNIVKFRDTKWCRPATAADAERCYSPAAAGLTTVVFVDDANSARDGEIVDADIELNGVDFAISNAGATGGDAPCLSDLKNTLTHELGHFLGLEHTCLASGDPLRVDDKGKAVPLCNGNNEPAIRDATMYNFQTCGETSKASLSPDDIAAVCSVYPLADDPGQCEGVGGSSGGCCSVSASSSSPLAPVVPALWALGLLAFVARRRR
jgi:MYXO-CTERM domain-containing protein